MIHKSVRRFKLRRELFPHPLSYYGQIFVRLNAGKKYTSVKCIFHKDSSPSLSLNLHTGSYRCFGCGAKGRSIIDFHMRRHELSFKGAMKELGSWK